MKTVSAPEFYLHAGLVVGLAEGRQLVVTANGKTTFVVSKGRRPEMTRILAKARGIGCRLSGFSTTEDITKIDPRKP